jgi:hypothetical protein
LDASPNKKACWLSPAGFLFVTRQRPTFPRPRGNSSISLGVLSRHCGIHPGPAEELLRAFRTTLEELRDADLLLHVVDASATSINLQIKSVISILEEHIPRLLVFNKCDRLPNGQVDPMCRRYQVIRISAL